MIQRTIASVHTVGLHRGFLGEGHMAGAVIDGSDHSGTDPFLLLMDDQLDLPGGPPAGGPHPHAGFETLTLVLEGDDQEWQTGSFELMTAGSGIVHTEEITSRTRMRILQLWLVLPPDLRWTSPSWQQILPDKVPVYKTADREIRVYSGSSNGINSPLRNHTPVTIADFRLAQGTEAVQEIPASYNGFIYMIDGSLVAGETTVHSGQVAWLDRPTGTNGDSRISFRAGDEGARFVLYAGEPQQAQVVSYGPFIGDTMEDIARLYGAYRQGQIPHLRDLPADRKVRYGHQHTPTHT